VTSELTHIAAELLTGNWASDCAEDWPARPTASTIAAAAARDRDRRHDLAHRLVHLKRRLGRLVYLASPYSHPSAAIRQRRYEQVLEATRLLMQDGHHVWSPIVYTHPMAKTGMAMDWGYWAAFDTMMLNRCQELWILTLDGWRDSEGIRSELRLAPRLAMPVRLVSMGDVEAGVPKNPTWQEHERTKTELRTDAPLAGCVCAECEELQEVCNHEQPDG
jgi:hypothetical protein